MTISIQSASAMVTVSDSDNIIRGLLWSDTSYPNTVGDKPIVDNMAGALTDGLKPKSPDAGFNGTVTFYNKSADAEYFVYDLPAGNQTFKQVVISTVNNEIWGQNTGDAPKKIKIEAEIDGTWHTLFENETPYENAGNENKDFVFGGDTAITAQKIKFSFGSDHTGWPGVAIDEFEVRKSAPANPDGALTAPDAPPVEYVAVSDITGVPTEGIVGEDITLTGTVAPDNATNKTIVWTVADAGETGAAIDGNVLKTTGAGTVKVTATITNGKTESENYVKDFTLTIKEAKTFVNVAQGASYTNTAHDDYYASADHTWNDPEGKYLTDGIKGTAPWGHEFVCYKFKVGEDTDRADWTWTIDLGGGKRNQRSQYWRICVLQLRRL